MQSIFDILKSRGKLGAAGVIVLSGVYLVDSFAVWNISNEIYLALIGVLEGLALFGIRSAMPPTA